jgi:tetratricopeptide (TPR) repeat protein
MELDQLYKRLNFSPEERLKKLEQYPGLVNFRDDLYLERAALYNALGQYDLALKLILGRKFHPWEGGEGKVTGQYVLSFTELAKKAIDQKEFEKAVELLNQAQVYPRSLGEGKLYGAQENDLFYWLGCALDGLGKTSEAKKYWEKASKGLKEPAPAIFYNDQQPVTIFYQGLALIKLGKAAEAEERFDTLINFGKLHLNDEFKLDYFAVSLPDLQIWDDDLSKRDRQNCQSLIELGEAGKKML